MKITDDRKLFSVPIGAEAAAGNIATIPQTQATAGDGTASVALGFPPETFIARAAGGEPPRGQDMNGLLNLLSGAVQVLQAGYLGPFDANFAQGIGGYPAGAIVAGVLPGAFWVSTADANVSTPGATGATWQSLFNGYATQAWANGQFLQLDDTEAQTVAGPVAFSGATTVPSVSAFTGADALNALSAEGRYVKSVPASGSTNVRIVDVQNDTSGDLIATRVDGTTQSYAPVTTGTFTDGRWKRTGNVLEQWWSQNAVSGDTVPFPLALVEAPVVFAYQTQHHGQDPSYVMGFTCIDDSLTTASSCTVRSLVIQGQTGGQFLPPQSGVTTKFYVIGVVS